MARKKISTTVYLELWQTAGFAHLSRTTNVPAAKLMRDAFDAYLEDMLSGDVLAQLRADHRSELERLRDRVDELEAEVRRGQERT